MLSQRSVRLPSFLFILFSIFCFTALISTFCLPGHVYILLPPLPCYWFLLVYCSPLFLSSSRSLVNISCIFSIFALHSFPRSYSLSLFWILFLEGCLSPLHLVVFLGFYLVPSSAFSSWLTFFILINCKVVFLAAAGLCFFLLLLSALWWRGLRVFLIQATGNVKNWVLLWWAGPCSVKL